MRAGFAVAEYTPAGTVRLGRLGSGSRPSVGMHLPLCARVAIFASGDAACGIVALDQILMTDTASAAFRDAMAAATGVPAHHFMVCITHTHNCPPIVPWRPEDDTGIFEMLRALLARLAAEAMGKMAPVRLRAGRGDASGWAMNRRPIYRAPDGCEQVATHGPRSGEDFLRMESPDESDLRVVLAESPDGRPIGGLVCFP